MSKYPEQIMKVLREWKNLDENDNSKDNELNKLTGTEVFDIMLRNEGVIGFTHTINKWLGDIYGANLDDLENVLKTNENCEKDYEPMCKYGCYGCIHDDNYIKYYHPEWHKELQKSNGIRSCDVCVGSNQYDDEDK